MWHGNNRKEAIKRVKEIKGVVVRRWSPVTGGGYGFYSELSGAIIRNSKRQVWPRRGESYRS